MSIQIELLCSSHEVYVSPVGRGKHTIGMQTEDGPVCVKFPALIFPSS